MTGIVTGASILGLGALAWLAWSIVRILIGPNRRKAAGNSGKAALLFIASVVVVGIAGAAGQNQSLANGQREIQLPPDSSLPVALPELEASTVVASIPVVIRYEASPTFVAIVVDKNTSTDKSTLMNIGEQACLHKTFCVAGIWKDDTLAPRRLKMTPTQVQGMLAQFVHRGGSTPDKMSLNCHFIEEIDRTNCLSD